jgi:iron complex transport system substrate-binding protein
MKQVIIPGEIEAIAKSVVNAAFAVHSTFGPGLLERVYHETLGIELLHNGLTIEREKQIPIHYRGHLVDASYRADLVVNGKLLVELKSVETLLPIHRVQTVTYLKLLKLPLGLLINFNTPLIKDGIHRVLNLEFQTESQN